MNSSSQEGKQLVEDILKEVHSLQKSNVVFSPPFVYLKEIGELLEGKENFFLSAQNMSQNDNGAFTGEISSSMLIDVGCEYVILGHSERRQYYGETNALINKKLKKALQSGLKPILCIGESLEEYEEGKTKDVVRQQVQEGLESLTAEDIVSLVIAYEPIWAIGTGKTSTPKNANSVHYEIRKIIMDLYGQGASERLCILYGGSVKASNSKELLSMEHIDGALVGGASLKSKEFIEIIYSSEQ